MTQMTNANECSEKTKKIVGNIAEMSKPAMNELGKQTKNANMTTGDMMSTTHNQPGKDIYKCRRNQ
jgi:hypothetical protein